MQENQKSKALEYHQQGYSYAQIGEFLGISKSAAYRLINESNEEDSYESEYYAEEEVPRGRKESKKADSKTENLNVQLELRRIELEHEEKMEQLRLNEAEREREFDSELLEWQGKYDDLIKLIDEKNEVLEELESEVAYLKENKDEPALIQTEVSSKVYSLAEEMLNLDNNRIDIEAFNQIEEECSSLKDKVIKECLRLGNIYNKVPEAILLEAIKPFILKVRDEFDSKGFFSDSTIVIKLPPSVKSILKDYL